MVPFLVSTAGEPRRAAEVALLEKKAAAEVALDDAFDNFNGTETDDESAENVTTGPALGKFTAEEEESLPPFWLPSPLAVLALFGVATCHALFHLLGRWTPPFQASALYEPAEGARRGQASHAIVFPPPNRGKPEIVALDYAIDAERDGYPEGTLARLVFQRQPFLLSAEGIAPLPLPTSLKVTSYLNSTGLDPADVAALRDRYGANQISLPPPRFITLLFEQMLSPLAVFQVFSALLWFLDGYSLLYTGISLGTVVMFEAMTVIQRTRTTGMLSTLAPPTKPVWCYRGSWVEVKESEVLPGDLVCVPEGSVGFDCVVIAGNGVVNEAMLTGGFFGVDLVLRPGPASDQVDLPPTGESVPLLKDPLIATSDSEHLEPEESHRIHALSSGTTLLSSTSPTSMPNTSVPMPPAPGLVAVVLRTGFSSQQGQLLQLIAYSQAPVSSDTKETFYALLMLFVFALVAAVYVWREGREKGKTVQELVVKSVVIITSVVPRGLPMQVGFFEAGTFFLLIGSLLMSRAQPPQMATAVHTALLSLFRAGIFCTEPHKVPLAGKVSHVLFDKTGTVTTDELVPAGVVDATGGEMEPVASAQGMAAVVLAACHSIIAVDPGKNAAAQGKKEEKKAAEGENKTIEEARQLVLAGDPIELAALKGVEWTWDHATSAATPGAFATKQLALEVLKKKLAELQGVPQANRTPEHDKRVKMTQTQIEEAEKLVSEDRRKADSAKFNKVEVVQRHHFASGLQRMSVVAKCSSKGTKDEWMCLVKGSPEAIGKLLADGATPEWYATKYEEMARNGLRVLALAYKSVSVSDKPAEKPREWAESNLRFAGFVAFECRVRADSGTVIRALLDSGHSVAMITGDGLLTSLHVAALVGICGKESRANLAAGPKWIVRNEKTGKEHEEEFEVGKIDGMAEKHDLVSTEVDFWAAAEATGGKESQLWNKAGLFKVFSRMSPHGKAAIIRAIQNSNQDSHVLMCGDGGNDVGALKQSDVAMALLAGHGNTNTTDSTEEVADGVEAEEALNKQTAQLAKKSAEFEAARVAHIKEFQARWNRESQAKMQEEIKERMEAGEYMAFFTVLKEQAGKMRAAIEAENKRFAAIHGQIWDPKKDAGSGGAANGGGLFGNLMAQIEAEGTDPNSLPMIRPGDASVAAPFTSRVPSIRAVIDLIRQGRCTLLSALMQQQIMMLESIIAAYTLSALTLNNARSSERQMMASSWLIMTAAVAFSYASPIDRMHQLRPLRSLFHPAIILSIFGQAIIHIACMTFAVNWATDAMGPEKLEEVKEFFRKAKAKEIDPYAACGDSDWVCLANAFWQAPFMPNLLNSVVFLVETSQMISVFFANYKGRPWMKGMMENHALFLSVFICIGGVIVAAWEMVPMLNEMLQLVPFPDDAFKFKVVALLSATIAGTFLWDRLCTWLFAPDIFAAMMEEARKTTLADLMPILTTLFKVVAGIAVLAQGNLLTIGLAYMGYRNWQTFQAKKAQEKEMAEQAAAEAKKAAAKKLGVKKIEGTK